MQPVEALAEEIHSLAERLARIEGVLNTLVLREASKDWYTTSEVATILGKAEFTVREWCRLGRVYAEKARCGRGQSQEWRISHAELVRIQNEGLLPVSKD